MRHRPLGLCTLGTLLVPLTTTAARAECQSPADLFTAQRVARGQLLAEADHQSLTDHMTGMRVETEPPSSQLTLVIDTGRWFGLSACTPDGPQETELFPSELSLRFTHHVRPGFDAGFELFGLLMENTLVVPTSPLSARDGRRYLLGGNIYLTRWFGAGATLLVDRGLFDVDPDARRLLARVGVPALDLWASVITDGVRQAPESVLLDARIPLGERLGLPLRLAWHEDEGLYTLRTGFERFGWGAAWVAVEDSEHMLRSAGLRADLLIDPGRMQAAYGIDTSAYPPSTTMIGFVGTLTYSGGRTVRALVGEPRIGGSLDFVVTGGVEGGTVDLRIGWAVDEADTLADQPHLAGFDVFRLVFGAQRNWF